MGECLTRFKLGALMGASVGAGMGLIIGSYSLMRFILWLISRFGHGGQGIIPILGKIVFQSAGSFSIIMGVGGLLRCDDGGK